MTMMKGDTPPMLMYGVIVALLFILVLVIVTMTLLSSMVGGTS